MGGRVSRTTSLEETLRRFQKVIDSGVRLGEAGRSAYAEQRAK